ncbi:2-dehydropantoate 2-reductase [Alkalimonas amylolytica]|uniref:2-dehydropantoate 2-reductase n=1 Tax=Alkalimonas amylolytica TaxID=152573 RepID=A0A1H4EZC8_ALKAM|nr:2-dehydropantoate 2-reductase [Alkalimonas amylolytica]
MVGQGAIGLLTACQLQQQGSSVRLWLRQPASLTVHFRALDGSSRHHRFEPWPASQPIQIAFIPVKAYDALSCIQQLQPLLAEDACLILSHNGLGTLETIQPLLKPKQHLWFLTTTHGAYIEPGNQAGRQLVHSGAGNSVLGAIQAGSDPRPSFAKALNLAIGPLLSVTDIKPYLWQKLLLNCLINPMTALHQVHNGELAKPHFTSELTQLLDEFCLLAERAGYPQDKAAAWQQLQQVITQTASNRSSMLQDRLAGRQTELEFITGFVLREAQRFDLLLPGHAQLYQLCQDAGF